MPKSATLKLQYTDRYVRRLITWGLDHCPAANPGKSDFTCTSFTGPKTLYFTEEKKIQTFFFNENPDFLYGNRLFLSNYA